MEWHHSNIMECSSPSKTSQKRLPTRSSPGRSCPPRPRGDRRSPGLLFVYLAPMRLEGGLTNGFLEAKDPNWRSKWRLACADWYLGKHLWTPSSAWSFVLHNILCHTHIYNHTVYIYIYFRSSRYDSRFPRVIPFPGLSGISLQGKLLCG